MLKRKRIRERGKLPLSKYFQKLNSGDSVAIVKDLGQQSSGFPRRMQGRTGKVIKMRGSAYEIEVSDFALKKRFVVKPVHLKKIQEMKKQ